MKKRHFTAPPTTMVFNLQVWDIVRQIPAGRVTTYGRIAAKIPAPAGVKPGTYLAFGPRWVGGAMARCPGDVPWHRVVNAQGKISLRKGTGRERQRVLLAAEGVLLDANQRIDLERFVWEPLSAG